MEKFGKNLRKKMDIPTTYLLISLIIVGLGKLWITRCARIEDVPQISCPDE